MDEELTDDEKSFILEAIAYFLEVCDEVTPSDIAVAARTTKKIGGASGD